MARHNAYIKPRVRKQKESFYITEEKRILTVLSFIKANGSVSDFDIKRIMKFGPGVHGRMMTDLKHNYQEYVSWDKKTRLFTHLKDYGIEEKPIEIKTLYPIYKSATQELYI